jgi:hypothetical protein
MINKYFNESILLSCQENTPTFLTQMIITLFGCLKRLQAIPANMSTTFYAGYMLTTFIFLNSLSTFRAFFYT